MTLPTMEGALRTTRAETAVETSTKQIKACFVSPLKDERYRTSSQKQMQKEGEITVGSGLRKHLDALDLKSSFSNKFLNVFFVRRGG